MSFLRPLVWSGIQQWIRSRFPQVSHISTAELADWLNEPSKEKPLLLDARKPEEYATSHLHRAQLASTHLEALQNSQISKTIPIVVYCSIGYRSAVLAQQLQNLGYEYVYNLEGSIFAWANEGYPIYKGETRVGQVHPYSSSWGWLLNPELR